MSQKNDREIDARVKATRATLLDWVENLRCHEGDGGFCDGALRAYQKVLRLLDGEGEREPNS